MATTTIIRANQLKKGDKFILLGIVQTVREVTATAIVYGRLQRTRYDWTDKAVIGRNSQQRVELLNETITLNNKQNENGNQSKSGNFSRPCTSCPFNGFNFGQHGSAR